MDPHNGEVVTLLPQKRDGLSEGTLWQSPCMAANSPRLATCRSVDVRGATGLAPDQQLWDRVSDEAPGASATGTRVEASVPPVPALAPVR